MTVPDPEFQTLVEIADALKTEAGVLPEEDPWHDSPFEWIKRIDSSSRKGKIGALLVERWCEELGLTVAPSQDREADRLISGRRVEIKFSTLWEKGFYMFQQIRDEDYEYAICLALSPLAAHCWVIPKTLLDANVIGKRGQHKGKDAEDTDWLKIDPDSPEEWLSDCGGSLTRASEALRKL